MDVLPEHVNVNIGLVSAAAPYVRRVSGFPGGIEIVFSRFMASESLTSGSFTVTQNGNPVPGEIVLADRETNFLEYDYLHGYIVGDFPGPTLNVREFASVIRFVPELELSGEALLVIDGSVASYADVPMGVDYSATISIVPEPVVIAAQHLTHNSSIALGATGNLIVNVYPAEAAVGMAILAVSDSPLIAEVLNDRVTVDASGQAVIEVNGVLPGLATIKLSLEHTLLTAQAAVSVDMPLTIREILGYPALTEIVVPEITSMNNHSVTYGTASTFQIEAFGTPVYSLIGAPAGVSINPATGLLSIAGSTAVGTHVFTIIASNGEATDAQQQFTLSVIPRGDNGFGEVPATGLPDLTGYAAAMLLFIAISAVLWGSVSRRRPK